MSRRSYHHRMRAPATLAATLFITLLAPVRAADVDAVIQAGHQGRPESCAPLHVKACNLGTRLGDQLERRWTVVVADSATAALRRRGFTVQRRPADYSAHDTARTAVFVHFDGSAPACASGASVGFPPGSDLAFAHTWEARYRRVFPFRFKGENITTNESEYYGFRKVDAPRKLLIEFGELTCPEQERWMQPRLQQLGVDLADFLAAELRS